MRIIVMTCQISLVTRGRFPLFFSRTLEKSVRILRKYTLAVTIYALRERTLSM